MNIELTADQKAFAQQAILSGRLHNESDAVKQALELWEERERTRAALLASLDAAEASIDRGEGIVITSESMQELAHDVSRRGRERRAAERSAHK